MGAAGRGCNMGWGARARPGKRTRCAAELQLLASPAGAPPPLPGRVPRRGIAGEPALRARASGASLTDQDSQLYCEPVPRRIPENRLKELLASATRVFVAHGYRRTQMADVAAALGVAKGTVYLSVESKAALFAACLRYADAEPPALSELVLPLAAPAPAALAAELRAVLARESVPPALAAALARDRATDARGELEAIVRELFALSQRHRTAIKLMDRCGADHPELAAIFYEQGRFSQVDRLTRYLESRIATGALRPVPTASVAARFIVETIATWAVHMHWDPAPRFSEPADAEATVVQFLLGGLLPRSAA